MYHVKCSSATEASIMSHVIDKLIADIGFHTHTQPLHHHLTPCLLVTSYASAVQSLCSPHCDTDMCAYVNNLHIRSETA